MENNEIEQIKGRERSSLISLMTFDSVFVEGASKKNEELVEEIHRLNDSYEGVREALRVTVTVRTSNPELERNSPVHEG